MMATVTKTKRKLSGAAAMGPGPGRPKGVPNKITKDFRQAVTRLLESTQDNMIQWLTTVAKGDEEAGIRPDPGKALDLMAKLAEYSNPKLGRVEHVGDGGGPVETVQRIELAPMAKAEK